MATKGKYRRTNVDKIDTDAGDVTIYLKNGEQLTIKFPGSPANRRKRAQSAVQYLGDAIWLPINDVAQYGR